MEHITFRPVTMEDAGLITRWKQDPLVARMALSKGFRTTEEVQLRDIRAFLDHPEEGRYDLILLGGDRPVGYIRIDWIDEEKRKAWLRFALGEERNRGIGREALRLFIRRLFAQGCYRIEAETYAFNQVSQHVLEANGFLREGVKRKAHWDGEDYSDIYLYGLLNEEKEPEKGPFISL